MKKIHIFTHRDLDGAGSYLVAKWFLSSPSVDISYTAISTALNARSEITSWLVKNSFADFTKVYFLDLDMYRCCVSAKVAMSFPGSHSS